MNLCLNTDLFKRYSIEQALSMVAEAGYQFVTLNAVPFWEPHLDFSNHDAAQQTQRLVHLLAACGLHLASAEIATNLSAWDEEERAQSVDYCRRAIDLLAPLGCRVMSVSAGGTNLFNKREQQTLLEKSLRDLDTHIQDSDIIITVDIYPGSCLESTNELLRIMEDLSLPHMRYMFCTPHIASLGEDLIQSYRLSRHRLGHIILADTPLSTVTHSHLTPGDGSIDFLPFFQALHQDNYTGFLTVQIYSHMDDDPLRHALRARMAVSEMLDKAASTLPA